jgi:hypothetical protein
MAPPDRLEEEPLAAAVDVVAGDVEDVAAVVVPEGAEDTGVVGSTGVSVTAADLLTPYGCMSLYTSQLDSGAASGQSFARQIEYSWPFMGGAQRMLYLAFIKVESVAASASEKP